MFQTVASVLFQFYLSLACEVYLTWPSVLFLVLPARGFVQFTSVHRTQCSFDYCPGPGPLMTSFVHFSSFLMKELCERYPAVYTSLHIHVLYLKYRCCSQAPDTISWYNAGYRLDDLFFLFCIPWYYFSRNNGYPLHLGYRPEFNYWIPRSAILRTTVQVHYFLGHQEHQVSLFFQSK